ncbi:Pyruvate dehydrogenase complex repressor [Ensifer sp. M14]|uniref:FadR/GntR family transcriptional regulator n=1 Tax=Ensifer sp. M14 TaxID=2203782 RepID=UPI000E1D3484|nr:FadR/GntR family transcriptional regulator [Ensifer sp. M14]RDL47957.1 Pyruvate dehydrogenase complex repressor [Ensifer sp. M14]
MGTMRANKGWLVLDKLGRDIAASVFQPDDRLPPEHELEQMFEVSRSVVREATKSLAAKGMVVVGPRLGARVAPLDQWSLLDRDVLEWVLAAPDADTRYHSAIDEVRHMIEPTSAMLAAERATASQLSEISAAYERMQKAAREEDTDAAVQADRDFHIAVLKATQNPILQAFDHAVGAILGVLFVTTHMEHFKTNLPRHGVVLDAILNRRPFEAGQAMTRVISFTSELMRKK